jgi:hypothetical protein
MLRVIDWEHQLAHFCRHFTLHNLHARFTFLALGLIFGICFGITFLTAVADGRPALKLFSDDR